MSSRASAYGLRLGVWLSVLFVSPSVFATSVRPYDAPIVTPSGSSGKAIPPRPTGYLEQEESGITFAYHPSAHERVRAAIPAVMRKREALAAELGFDILKSIEIRVAAVPDEMRTLGPLEDVPAYAPALVYSHQQLIVTSLRSPRSLEPTDLALTLRHALGHLALDEAVSFHAVPIWLHEGYAVVSAGETSATRAQALLMANWQHRLMPIADLETSFPADAPETSLAYAESADLVHYLMDKPRKPAFSEMLLRLRNGEPFEQALTLSYDADYARLDAGFRKDMARRYGFITVFLVSGAIWLAMGILFAVRRASERKQEMERHLARKAQKPRRDELEEAAQAKAQSTQEPPLELSAVQEGMGKALLPESEVPKVEHEGDWHTLH